MWIQLISLAAPLMAASIAPATAATKIVIIAGNPSHGPGDHEFNAGTQLLADCLKMVKGIEPVLVRGGWPTDESVFYGAKSVVFYMDGGSGHPMIQTKERMLLMKRLMDSGAGLVCLHYAVEFPKGEAGDQLLEWLGGYYETGYSTNPINDALMTTNAKHPICEGVKPFQIQDEWYYRIRFRPDDRRVTPILTTRLPKDKPNTEICAWATVRDKGGRSFGFTGAHFHKNWGNQDFRTLVLNAILWSAKVNIPKSGVASIVTADQLTANLDPKR